MKTFSLTFLFFLSISAFLQAQSLQQKADEYVNRYFELKRFSGKVVVAKNTEILFSKGYGLADLEHNLPITDSTLFCVTGITEQFTAYITLKLADEQKLALHEPVQKYMGKIDFKHGEAITIHHLLTHTSGLPDYLNYQELPKSQFFSKKDMAAYLQNVALDNQPGEKKNYSVLNFNLLGLILEQVTGKPYGQLLAEYISVPHAMNNTRLDNYADIANHRARGYTYTNFEKGWVNAPYLDPANTFAAQGVLSTAADLLKWHSYLRNTYATDSVVQHMLAPYEDRPGYGLQATFGKANRIKAIHSIAAYNSGFNTYSTIDLDNDLVILVLGNCRNPSSRDIAQGLHAIFNGMSYELPLPRQVVRVPPAALKKLAGAYKINEHVTIQVVAEGSKLFIDDGMHPRFEVFPQSENQFFMKDRDAEIVFIKNAKGEVTRLGLRDDGFTNGYAHKITKQK